MPPSFSQDEVLQAMLEQRAAAKREGMLTSQPVAEPPVDLPFSNRIAGAFEAAQPVRQVDELSAPVTLPFAARNRLGDWAPRVPNALKTMADPRTSPIGPAAIARLFLDPAGEVGRQVETGKQLAAPFTQFNDPSVDPVKQAADLALTVGAGGLATAGGRSGVGVFGGRLAKTANLEKLTIAEQMAAKGAPPARIWQETGWFKGADDKWRFEISDEAASLNEPIPMGGSGDVAPLGERLQHERAYEAYPDLKNIKSQVEMWEGGGGGAYGPDDTGTEALFASGRDPLFLKKTALHELQHAVQAREGFARGGNPNALIEDALAMRKRWEDVEKPQAEKILKAEEDIYSEWLDNERINQGMPHGKAQVDAFRARYAQQFPESAARRNAAMDVLTKGPPKSRDIYERLAGETEARNVSTRSQWADKFRRADPPWKTQDVPTEQQIVRFRDR